MRREYDIDLMNSAIVVLPHDVAMSKSIHTMNCQAVVILPEGAVVPNLDNIARHAKELTIAKQREDDARWERMNRGS